MASGKDSRAPVAPIALRDAILFQLALRGRVRAGDLRAATGADASELDAALGALVRDGSVACDVQLGGNPLALSSAGRERAADAVAREAVALRPAVEPLDAEFAALNRRVKETLLRWQVRVDRTPQVPNDHADARYDAVVLRELGALQLGVDRLLASLAPLRARYANLRRRLADAIARARAGDRTAVAGVVQDSFHAAWWELHGDLLAILGRARGADDA